jgi:hypothetical protein
MKKLYFCILLSLICLSFITIQNNDRKNNASSNISESKMSIGWNTLLIPDTEKFYGVYFKTENLGGIFTGHQPFKRTTNGGVNWGYGVVPNLFDPYPGIPKMNGNRDMIVASYHVNTPNCDIYLYKTTDFGMSWSIAYSNGGWSTTGDLIRLWGCYKQVFYMDAPVLPSPANFRNTNGGEGGWTWLTAASGYIIPDAISYTNIDLIYGIFNNVGIGSCIISASQTFTILKNGVFHKICVVDSNNILATSNLKLYRSTNAGVTWDTTSFPARLNSISFPDQNTGYMTGSNGKIFKSTNKGANWISQYTPTTDSLVDCCFLNSQTGYIIGYNGTLLKTTDGGGSPVSTISGSVRYSDNNQPVTGGTVKAFKLDKITSDIIILDTAIIQSDGSYTLPNVPQDSVDIGVFPNSTPPCDYVVTYYPSTIYWERATVLYPTGNLTNINIGATRMSASTNSNSINGKVMRLTDNPVGNLKDAVLYAKNGNTFVRCGVSDANGVYHLASLPIGNLKILATRLGFSRDSVSVNVTSSSNIDSINFYLNRMNVGIRQINSVVPSEFKLFRNYPNPFNPSTNIKYQIAKNSFVSLKVYDLLGREIATLVDEYQKAGTYETQFSINSITNNQQSSGIYFYKLTAVDPLGRTGDFTETKKMVLLK